MQSDSVTLMKSKAFAIRIVKLYQYLSIEKKEYVLSKQILRSGTSIGANISEAIYGISGKDFLSKIYISLKECSETRFWIDLLYETGYISEKEYTSINKDCIELIRLLSATSNTMSKKLKGKQTT